MLQDILNKLLYWRLKHIGSRTFLIIVSVIIGIVSGLAAVLLKLFVQLLHHITENITAITSTKIWYFILPIIGIILTVIVVKIVFKGKLEKGLESILFAISKKSSRIERSKTFSQLITSGLTVGLGGSAGLEAPIVITGSAIGSNLASFFRFDYRERTLLLACGAAAGIAAVFNSPIAGVIFAVEVLLIGFSVTDFIPILISTASATILSKFLYKGQLFYLISNDWYFHAIPYYIVLGALCGFLSIYVIRVTLGMENFFHKIKSEYKKLVFGSLVLGLLIFLLPPLFGEGYSTIETLLTGSFTELLKNSFLSQYQNNLWIPVIFALVLVLVKIIATSLTTGSGGNGGIFAPSLFIGALTGFILASSVNLLGISNLHISNFIVVGMAGVLSGVVHAPLTAIFLIAEITGGYVLFVPLMIVSALSFFITKYFEPYSIYTKNLAHKGLIPTDNKDNNILTDMNLIDLVERDFYVLNVNDQIVTLKVAFENSRRNLFPVIDDSGILYGLLYLEATKKFILNPELGQHMTIKDITDTRFLTVDIKDNMLIVMDKFEKSGQWNIAVTENGKYLGFVSHSTIMKYYRTSVKKKVSLF